VYVCMCVCRYVCVYICMYVCMYVCVCMCECMYVGMCVYVCMYVCMYLLYVPACIFMFATLYSGLCFQKNTTKSIPSPSIPRTL